MTPFDYDPSDDRLYRLMAASMGWAADRDGFEGSGGGVSASASEVGAEPVPPSPTSLFARTLALAEEWAAAGCWQMPRLLSRAALIGKAEIAKVLADELAPSAAHRAHEDVPNLMAMFDRRKR